MIAAALEEARGIGYVTAVACSTRVRINHCRTPVHADTAADAAPNPSPDPHPPAGSHL
ncbi:hypothetical protein QF035_001098 [Streptomyces umbrinus]|uniref:Uncharacterized protein n=1 Tax=Streptomyces umbrinus TaxID=67370 RepID=A0ABU0SLD2_9ACTN|nr:hypothetical protein [Streptomyces umbrinus]MDQ1023516.1 hypothetical protein [Streptomyces umbrinus]